MGDIVMALCVTGLFWLPVAFAAFALGRRQVTWRFALTLVAAEIALLLCNAIRYTYLMRDFH